MTQFMRLLLGTIWISLGLSLTGCSSSDQQGQQGQEELQGDEQGEQGQEDLDQLGDQEGGEGEENYGDEAYGAAQGTEEEAGDALGGYDEAMGEETPPSDELAEGVGEQGDLQQIIDEMNGAPEGGAIEEVQQVDPMAAAGGAMGGAPATASVDVPAGLPEMNSKMSYIVQKGDTLAAIAQKIYGDRSMWRSISEFSGLSNPNRIFVGDVVYYQLTEQSLAFATAYESVQRSEVVVQPGDTLTSIASRTLGSPQNWPLLWRANDTVDYPHKLEAGTTLYYVAPGALAEQIKIEQEKLAQLRSANSEKVASTSKNVKVMAERKLIKNAKSA